MLPMVSQFYFFFTSRIDYQRELALSQQYWYDREYIHGPLLWYNLFYMQESLQGFIPFYLQAVFNPIEFSHISMNASRRR